MKVRMIGWQGRAKKTEARLWTRFVEGHPEGAIEQSWEWGNLQTSIPGRENFFVIGLFEGGRLTGGILVVRQEMGFQKSWLWCPRGPLLPKKGARIAWRALKKACEKVAEEGGDVFLRVESGFPTTARPLAAPAGPLIKGKVSQEQYLPEHTLILDLKQSEGDLLAQMSQSARRNIRIAERSGVKVEKGNEADIPIFYSLLRETAKRDGFSIHKKEFYRKFLALPGERASLYLAKIQGEVAGGILVAYFGKKATYYWGATSNQHREAKVGYQLQWFAIQDAKRFGLKTYDFLGIAPEGVSGHPLAGVTQFKKSFGGRKVAYQKAQVFVYRPVWWALYRLGKFLRRGKSI